MSQMRQTSLHINKVEMTSINIHLSNSAPNFIEQPLLTYKTQTEPNTMLVEDFNTPL
jgi:hypothetical protein